MAAVRRRVRGHRRRPRCRRVRQPALGAALIGLLHVLPGAAGRISPVAGLAGSSASTAALVTVGALGGSASPVTTVLFALAGANGIPAPARRGDGRGGDLLEVKPYWVVFALAAILRPGLASVRSSARDTVTGTVAGAVLATVLVHLLPGTWPLVPALLAITVAALRVLDFAAGAAIALALAWLVGRPWVGTRPDRPGTETGGPT
ncbi:MAG: FUSC family protein [Actinomycetota bacterium]